MILTPDLVNGLFEIVGGLLLWLNIMKLRKDKKVAGVHAGPIFFYTGWGIWNLFYYPAIGQMMSFVGGTMVMLANVIWLLMYWRLKRKERSDVMA